MMKLVRERQRYLSNPNQKDEGSALIIVILLLVAILGMLTIISGALMISTLNTKESRDRAAYGVAIDTAMNDVLNVANTYSGTYNPSSGATQGLYSRTGYNNHEEGVLKSDTANNALSSNGKVRYRWWVAPASSAESNSKYYVYITAFRGNDPRDDENALYARATLDSQRIINYTINGSGDITYRLANEEMYKQNFFGGNGVKVYDVTNFLSYDSAAQGTNPTFSGSAKNGQLATNANIEFFTQADNDYKINTVSLGAYDRSGINNRCYLLTAAGAKITTSTCPTTNVHSTEYAISAQAVATMANTHGCTAAAASSRGNWVASANGNTLAPNLGSKVLCVENMTFDGAATTTFSNNFSTGAPLTIIARGNVTMAPGHKIAPPQNSPVYGPPALRIMGTGSFTMNTGTSDLGDSKAYGLMTFDDACRLNYFSSGGTYANAHNQTTTVNGSLSCGDTLTIGKGVNLYFDRQANSASSDSNSGAISRIWSQTDFRTIVESELDNSFPN